MRSITTSLIRRHIFGLPLGQIFTSRELLSYGRRPAVDQAIARLVRSNVIVRLARGVFVRDGSPTPSAFEIARAKAEAFGKKLAAHGQTLAFELGLLPEPPPAPTFAVSGSSSSFQLGTTRVRLQKTATRKLLLGDEPAGRVLRALWQLGNKMIDCSRLAMATASLGRTDRLAIRRAAALLPAWLTHHFLR